VADSVTPVDLRRALRDGSFAGEYAAGIDAAIALAPELAHDAGVAPEVTVGATIPANAAIDRFVADAQGSLLGGYSGDLLRASAFAQEAANHAQLFGTEVRLASTTAAAGDSIAVSFLCLVVTVVGSHVALGSRVMVLRWRPSARAMAVGEDPHFK